MNENTLKPQDLPFAEFLVEEGYIMPRKLPTGEWVAVCQFILTWGLLVGVDRVGYRTRFCYERQKDAMLAALRWDGTGDPPGPWIKEKGAIDRLNPNLMDI